MIKVSADEFAKQLSNWKFVPIMFGSGVNLGNSRFFGMEVGNDVIVLQEWNSDFCTASFKIPNAYLVECNGQYTIRTERGEGDWLPIQEEPVMEDESGEASLEQRFASIEAAAKDADLVVLPEPIKEEPKPEPVKQMDKPVITKGRQKPEEVKKDPVPQTIVKKEETPLAAKPVKPTPKPVVKAPKPAVNKPTDNDDFGDW